MNRNNLKKIYAGLIGAITVLLALFFLFDWGKENEFSPINQLRIDCNDAYQKIKSSWGSEEPDFYAIAKTAKENGIFMTIIDTNEEVLFSNSSSINLDNSEILKEALYMDNAYISCNDDTYKLAQPIYDGHKVVGFVIFEKTYEYRQKALDAKYIMAALLCVFILILITILGAEAYKKQPREIGEIKDALYGITKGTYATLQLTKNDEYAELYHTYNIMVEEIKYIMEKKEYNEHQRKVFINQISHELKTPISTINAYVEGLKNNLAADEEKRQNYIDIIHNKMNQLTELVNDFFAYAQEDAQHFKYNFEECYANTIIDEIFAGIKGQNDKRTTCNNMLPQCIVNVDKVRLEQVVLNLYNNAKKHTEAGDSIKVSAYREDDNIVIEVCDSGAGIPVNELPYIFDSYYQGSKSKRTDYQGAGLGLSICKSIIDAHKGSMKVKSQVDIGTTMYVYIPMV